MSQTALPMVLPKVDPSRQTDPRETREPAYLVMCWNDPVNLMDYVSRVFQKVFGWPREKAEQHMMEVHQKGKSLLLRESLERAEHHVHQLQGHGLHATLELES